MSSVFDRVNWPPILPTLPLVQYIFASASIVALAPAADKSPPTRAFDEVPLPVWSRPLLPGPAAEAVAGATRAATSIAATATHPTPCLLMARCFMSWSPRCRIPGEWMPGTGMPPFACLRGEVYIIGYRSWVVQYLRASRQCT